MEAANRSDTEFDRVSWSSSGQLSARPRGARGTAGRFASALLLAVQLQFFLNPHVPDTLQFGASCELFPTMDCVLHL